MCSLTYFLCSLVYFLCSLIYFLCSLCVKQINAFTEMCNHFHEYLCSGRLFIVVIKDSSSASLHLNCDHVVNVFFTSVERMSHISVSVPREAMKENICHQCFTDTLIIFQSLFSELLLFVVSSLNEKKK